MNRWSSWFLGVSAVAAMAACSDGVAPPVAADGGSTGSTGGFGGSAVDGGAGGESTYAPSFLFYDAEGQSATELRYGEIFAIAMEGLPPNVEVTIESATFGYEGWATFSSGDGGAIDTGIDAPIAGTYDGVEPEGLLWSMVAVAPDGEPTIDVEVEAKIADQVVASATLHRTYLNEGLISEMVDEDGLVGVAYKPQDADGKFPALLVVGGSEGGIDSAAFGAAWLAGYGYVTLGLAYFDEPGLPPELTQIPLEYFETALAHLASRPDVDPERIGVVGGSRGGELVLMLGEQFPVVRAVVAQVPSGVRWGSVSVGDGAGWTYEGNDLPYLTTDSGKLPPQETLPNGEIAYHLTPAFDDALDTASADALAAATIHVESTQGPILLLAGEDDRLWPSCRLSQIALDRLDASGHAATHGDELYCFPEAGHVGPYPGSPTTDSYAYDAGAYWLLTGGTAKANAHAQRQGLDALRSFLARSL